MAYTIALAGKGGTGKTTVAALLIKALRSRLDKSILAVDADPNSNLAELLGAQTPESVGSILDTIAAAPDKIPAGMSKDRFIAYKVQTAIVAGEGFDLLTMGKPEGPGCYCYVNNVLRGVMEGLISDYDYVVIDNEAGLEHLSRRTTRRADMLLTVANNTVVSLRAAERIRALIDELKIDVGRRDLIVNQLRDEVLEEEIVKTGLDFLGSVPDDVQIEENSRTGRSVMTLPADSLSQTALTALFEKLLI